MRIYEDMVKWDFPCGQELNHTDMLRIFGGNANVVWGWQLMANVPEVGHLVAQVLQHMPQEGQAEANDVGVAAYELFYK